MGCSSSKGVEVANKNSAQRREAAQEKAASGGGSTSEGTGTSGCQLRAASSSARAAAECLSDEADDIPAEPLSVSIPSWGSQHPQWKGASKGNSGTDDAGGLSEYAPDPDADIDCAGAGAASPAASPMAAFNKVSGAAVPSLLRCITDNSWVAAHNDVAYYCKAPLALLEAGREADARTALDLAARYLQAGGTGSACQEHASVYPQGPWLWMCWAACNLQRDQLADDCFTKICQYKHPWTDSGLVKAPYAWGVRYEADFMATAVVCKAAMLRRAYDLAAAAGDSLLRALEANRASMSTRRRFNLRWAWDAGFTDEVCVLQDLPEPGAREQRFSMLGFPAAVLLELSSAEAPRAVARRRAYREGAARLLDFLKGCRGLQASPGAHVVAYAAALAGDAELSKQLADGLAARAQPPSPKSAPEAFDHAAEMLIWLSQAGKAQRFQGVRTISL